MSLTIAVTGANGLLGRELSSLQCPGITLIPLTKDDLDITDPVQCLRVLKDVFPDIVIQAAAYTAVDKAESEPDVAFRINADGAKHMAEAAKAVGAKLCYVSTDYVFDGKSHVPYGTNAHPQPQTVYGMSKLAGERYIQDIMEQFFIVRTSWLYGNYGQHFVAAMLKLARENDQIRVVNDQWGSPTYAYDLARFLIELVQSEQYGTYHASNSGSCTWHAFAEAIFRLAEKPVEVVPCSSEEFVRSAQRPAYSVLDCDELIQRGFQPMRTWEKALEQYLLG